MRKSSIMLYEIICQNFYWTLRRINNVSTIILQNYYKHWKKQQSNSRFEQNFMKKRNRNDFENALT